MANVAENIDIFVLATIQADNFSPNTRFLNPHIYRDVDILHLHYLLVTYIYLSPKHSRNIQYHKQGKASGIPGALYDTKEEPYVNKNPVLSPRLIIITNKNPVLSPRPRLEYFDILSRGEIPRLYKLAAKFPGNLGLNTHRIVYPGRVPRGKNQDISSHTARGYTAC